MTISIWRYSHLALAVSSFLFILVAAITGCILAVEPILDKTQGVEAASSNQISLGETVTTFRENYPEVISLEVDGNDFLSASVITEEGEFLEGYFNPETAAFLGEKKERSKIFQFATTLHRSLFLKSLGRFFVGLCSFLLFLIAVSGSILVIKRQKGIKRFFSRIINENFSQYWHVVLGRLSLIPIIIITLTGVYLSLEKFNVFTAEVGRHNLPEEQLAETPQLPVSEFPIFKNTPLAEVNSMEFPFSSDVEDPFILKLSNRELMINQITGEVISEIRFPVTDLLSNLSLTLHTGRGSIIWSIILFVASLNILFFIYSGFVITIRRRKVRIRNKIKSEEAKIIILAGSENGSTLGFAKNFHQALLNSGQKAFLTEPNNYKNFNEAEQLVMFTATYGQGDPPANASKFLKLLDEKPQNKALNFAVLGFGSIAYPDYCQFAVATENNLKSKFGRPLLPLLKVNDKSYESFENWCRQYSRETGIAFELPENNLKEAPANLKTFTLLNKTKVVKDVEETFSINIALKRSQQFTSGDLLAIYPENDARERLYSVGKIGKDIQLSVKYFHNGLGSGFLYRLAEGEKFKARIIRNSSFHFPKKAIKVIMIANGTGIAPFLGMFSEKRKNQELHLYLGLRNNNSYELYKKQIDAHIANEKISKFNLALSREDKKVYVQHLLKRDSELIAALLEENAVIMICGSIVMQNSVLAQMEESCLKYNQQPLSFYTQKDQIRTDCY